MTTTHYARMLALGAALGLGACREAEAPQREVKQREVNYGSSYNRLCASSFYVQRDSSRRITSLQFSTTAGLGECFYRPGSKSECEGQDHKSLPMSEQLQDAAERLLSAEDDLALFVTSAKYAARHSRDETLFNGWEKLVTKKYTARHSSGGKK